MRKAKNKSIVSGTNASHTYPYHGVKTLQREHAIEQELNERPACSPYVRAASPVGYNEALESSNRIFKFISLVKDEKTRLPYPT